MYRLTRRSWPERVATEAQLANAHRRELSDLGIRAWLAPSRRRSASERANSHCARRYTREPKSSLEMTYVLGRPTMKIKPMLGDETEARIPAGQRFELRPVWPPAVDRGVGLA